MQHANIKFIPQSSQIHFPLQGKSGGINCVYAGSHKKLVSTPCEHETKTSEVRAHSKLTAEPRTSDYHGLSAEFYWNVRKNNFGRRSGSGQVRASYQRKLRLKPALASCRMFAVALTDGAHWLLYKCKVHPVQALRFCTVRAAYTGSRGIAVLYKY